jgi:hypothetical protein
MTVALSPQVEAQASDAGFSSPLAAIRHPNGKVYAFSYGLWAVLLAMYPVATVVLLAAGGLQNANWVTVVLADLAAIALVWFLGSRAVGSVRKRAFYLYREGYIATKASGKVAVVKRWEDVSRIEGAGPGVHLVATNRVMCAIHHHNGRPIRFSEVLGREVLAPLAYELHAEATELSRE